MGILCSMTLASASLKGGQPTGVTESETGVRIRTVASPASSIRTSFPAVFKAVAHTKGKFARVGFSEPQSPTSRYLAGELPPPPDVPSWAASADAPAIAASPAHPCIADVSIDLLVRDMRKPPQAAGSPARPGRLTRCVSAG